LFFERTRETVKGIYRFGYESIQEGFAEDGSSGGGIDWEYAVVFGSDTGFG